MLRVASTDSRGGNHDFLTLEPGKSTTILDVAGPGMIRRFWMTFAPRSNAKIHRQVILKMYWDGEQTPSVEVPIGEFFGATFGEQRDFSSLPLSQTSGGYTAWWPMPFHRSAKWTVTNLGETPVPSFYFQIDYSRLDRLPGDPRYFHAQWRQERTTRKGEDYLILETPGEGHYVGMLLSMQAVGQRDMWFLEGDEKFFIDGESQPSIQGTGTEDYFSGGWYFDKGVFSAPYHGVILKEPQNFRVSAYRWHMEDPIPFRKSLRVTMEHGSFFDGQVNQLDAAFSSVAFYYQKEPHRVTHRQPLTAAELEPWPLPPPVATIPGILEAEEMLTKIKVGEGQLFKEFAGGPTNRMSPPAWSNDAYLKWWDAKRAQSQLSWELSGLKAERRPLTLYLGRCKDASIIEVWLNGQKVGQSIDLFVADNWDWVHPTGPISLGVVQLKEGGNLLELRSVGKNASAADPNATWVYVDGLVLGSPVP
jgi:hypothetical protein